MDKTSSPKKTVISAEFPFKSHYINVLGAKMHYIEKGKGKPILFLHGIPASSYLWRNIIPKLSKGAHCVAPDLIGTGKSEQPDIEYNINNIIKYLEAFIEALDLKEITLVVHGIGSIIGLHYAMYHPENIQGIVFYESYVGEIGSWKKLSLPLQHLNALLQNPKTSQETILNDPDLIKKIFATTSIRKLSEIELKNYLSPFSTPKGRHILWQYIQESPFGRNAQNIVQLIDKYTHFLEKTLIPKLLIYTIPGFVMSIDNIIWCREHLPNLTLTDMGQGLHFVQEYNPTGFSKAIKEWLSKIRT